MTFESWESPLPPSVSKFLCLCFSPPPPPPPPPPPLSLHLSLSPPSPSLPPSPPPLSLSLSVSDWKITKEQVLLALSMWSPCKTDNRNFEHVYVCAGMVLPRVVCLSPSVTLLVKWRQIELLTCTWQWEICTWSDQSAWYQRLDISLTTLLSSITISSLLFLLVHHMETLQIPFLSGS